MNVLKVTEARIFVQTLYKIRSDTDYSGVMPLIIYRRHSTRCRVHTLGLSAREVRHYRDCECPIWAYGITDTAEYPRQSLHTRDWAVAEAKLRARQAAAVDVAVHGPTITDSVRRHLDSHANNIGHRALGHHRLTLRRLEEFARSRNALFMSDLTVDLLEDFKTYALAKFKSTTRHLAVTKLRFFLREAYRRGWIVEALHERVRATRAMYEQKQPYTDDEIRRVLAHVEADAGHGRQGYTAHPATFRLLIEFMLTTGVRVSDAIRYDPARCTRGEHMWVYRFEPVKQRRGEKTKHAEVYLPEPLKLTIDGAVWFSPTHPFAYRAFDANNTMERAVLERMQGIGKLCGVADVRPHRLRDTFAVRALVRGMALEDVSRLLCHSSVAITEKYYAPWVPARQNRLEGLLAQTLVDAVRD